MSCATDAGIGLFDAVQRLQDDVVGTILNELKDLQDKFEAAAAGFRSSLRKVQEAETNADIEAAEIESIMFIDKGYNLLDKYGEILENIDYDGIYNLFDQAPESEELDREALRNEINGYRTTIEEWADDVYENHHPSQWERRLTGMGSVMRSRLQARSRPAESVEGMDEDGELSKLEEGEIRE